MTARQLAKRTGLSDHDVRELEDAETIGTAQLLLLQRAAEQSRSLCDWRIPSPVRQSRVRGERPPPATRSGLADCPSCGSPLSGPDLSERFLDGSRSGRPRKGPAPPFVR